MLSFAATACLLHRSAATSTNSWQGGNSTKVLKMHCYLMTTVSKSGMSYHPHNHTAPSDKFPGSAHLLCDKGWLLSPTSFALQPFQALISRPQERVAQGSLLSIPPASYLLAKMLGPTPPWNKCEHLQHSQILMSLSIAWRLPSAFPEGAPTMQRGLLAAQAACCTS